MKKLFLTALVVQLFYFSSVYSDWIDASDGLFGGNVVAVTANGTKLFAGVNYGTIYSSVDNGTTWAPYILNYNSVTPYIYDVKSNNGNIFACTNYGLFLSTDNGTTWINKNIGSIRRIAFNSSTCYTAGGTAGVYKSIDNGLNWTSITALSAGNYYGISCIGSYVFAGRRYGGGVYSSTNGGVNWSQVNIGLTCDSVTRLVNAGNVLFAVTMQGTFKTTNYGINWSKVTTLPDYSITLFSSGNTLYTANVNSNLLYSNDFGNTWTPLNNGLTGYIIDLVQQSNNFYAATGAGIFKSTNSGSSWAFSSNNIKKVTATEMLVFNNDYYLSTYSGIYKSTNNASSWSPSNTGLNNLSSMCLTNSGNVLYCGAGDGVYSSTNYGTSWNKISSQIGNQYIDAVTIFNGKIYAGGGTKSIYISSNNGVNWTTSNLPTTDAGYITDFQDAGSTIYVSVWDSLGLYKSTNEGLNWTPVAFTSLVNYPALGYKLYSSSYGIYFGAGLYGLFFSSNAGLNWVNLDDMVHIQGGNAHAIKGQNIFSGYTNVYLSPDNGVNWTEVSTGLSVNSFIQNFGMSQTHIYAFLYLDGVRKRAFSEMPIKVIQISSSVPSNYSLSQNYPNPFNPVTKIKFGIPNNSYLRINVFDMSGREVKILSEKNYLAGYYELIWDASDLPSGVYFVRLTAEQNNNKIIFNSTIKTLLIK